MKSTVSYSTFRWKIINYFNYSSFVLETDKNFLVTSNNLFHSTKWRVKQRQSCRQRLLKPLKSTHTAKYLSFLQYPIMFITESSFLFEIRGAGAGCDTAERLQLLCTSWHLTPLIHAPFRILYVTSLNLHFGLMCTFICILENFKLFPRLRFTLSCFPSSETHQHFMCKWRKASSFAEHHPAPDCTENRLWCKLKIKISSFFDVCLWRLKLYHLSILFYSFVQTKGETQNVTIWEKGGVWSGRKSLIKIIRMKRERKVLTNTAENLSSFTTSKCFQLAVSCDDMRLSINLGVLQFCYFEVGFTWP